MVENVLSRGALGGRGIEEEVGKCCGRVNIVEILCMPICKRRNDTC
jgi:hypothetical protein